ncbi:bacteriocin [Photobacterium damselae subsp. damselae]|uniref:bacteriocin n=1 Tax=Photobacterium damselae TaxID=38293 RepID=UPI001F38D33D|nr:bacteriocin [Photobacterium damselae]UJZ96336.1 bacteriocin [Photobacterium damselae subsp. damselae]UJZ99760.1 bacteriocin [Photobacterium damselae subsp. damselae]UKA07754.1 bacteriocin [Photobacterium damselae subsp. damselae]UKA12669.1 bacteriocin [Photobacterium damselae subsp. damselae]UKA23918.1 bacteriocin [Photobacterium damselae subsp. damselae]
MSYSILDIGRDTRRQALTGLRDAASRETERENADEQLKAAKQTQTMNAIGSGAAMGAMIGGPVGAVIGAAGGALINGIFS